MSKQKEKPELKKKSAANGRGDEMLSAKENEDLFKIAFRNYLNLVALADRKAGLLIQVSSIIASVIIGFMIRRPQDYVNLERGQNFVLLAIPVGIILVVSAATIFLGILASKPLEKKFLYPAGNKELFFFGSFDRLDPNFQKVGWEKYSADIDALFRSDKKNIFDELIKESYQVRKVLSKKFGYLSLAYKTFFAGLLVSIMAFTVALIHGT